MDRKDLQRRMAKQEHQQRRQLLDQFLNRAILKQTKPIDGDHFGEWLDAMGRRNPRPLNHLRDVDSALSDV
jgi:hypothetical protein